MNPGMSAAAVWLAITLVSTAAAGQIPPGGYDRDGDGIVNEYDACPDEPGSAIGTTDGCPAVSAPAPATLPSHPPLVPVSPTSEPDEVPHREGDPVPPGWRVEERSTLRGMTIA